MKVIPVLIAFLAVQPAHAFWTMFRWGITPESPAICWALDPEIPATAGLSEAAVKNLISTNIALWEKVSGSFLRFAECALPTDLEKLDGSKTILFRVRDDVPSSTGGCMNLEYEGGRWVCDAGRVNLSVNDLKFSESRMRQVIVHEVGHAIGLHHSDRHSIMAYHLPADELTSDDWAAISYLYPAGDNSEYKAMGCATVSQGSDGSGPGRSGPQISWALLFLFAWAVRGLVIRALARAK